MYCPQWELVEDLEVSAASASISQLRQRTGLEDLPALPRAEA